MAIARIVWSMDRTNEINMMYAPSDDAHIYPGRNFSSDM